MYRMQAFGQYEGDGFASTLKKRDHKDATDLVVLPREREREREERGRERGHGDDPLRGGRLNGASGPPDRGRGYGVNPGNDEIAGALVGNSQGGQRTTDLAGAYVVRERERERAPGVPQVKKGGERD